MNEVVNNNQNVNNVNNPNGMDPTNSTNTKLSIFYLVTKRTFDIIISLIGLLILAPVTIFIKIISTISNDYNSIFFTQKRIGKNGQEFTLYKFRTMVPNAEQILADMLANNPAIKEEYDRTKNLTNDPRITEAGNILKKLSIDGLPQMLNVLKGEMSIIGNCPYLPEEINDMGNYYNDIIKTKPGIISYYKTSNVENGTFETRLKFESYYSHACSIKLDMNILSKSFKNRFKRK